uniref:Calmodulin n=1 Tax=Trepomonas sp. PC1 TaxID=1076344 RepID=A0A146K304_9EUKA|eukprot:JAP90828.1 Calmodulin [Trepomonas sp. PC1]
MTPNGKYKIPNKAGAQTSFNHVDKNNDKRLQVSELTTVFEKLGMEVKVEHIEQIMKVMDQDKSNSLSFDEFFQLAYVIYNNGLTDVKLMAFLVHDVDKSGTLELSEVVKIFERNGIKTNENNLRQFFEAALNKKDVQKVEFEEFVEAMDKLIKEQEGHEQKKE